MSNVEIVRERNLNTIRDIRDREGLGAAGQYLVDKFYFIDAKVISRWRRSPKKYLVDSIESIQKGVAKQNRSADADKNVVAFMRALSESSPSARLKNTELAGEIILHGGVTIEDYLRIADGE